MATDSTVSNWAENCETDVRRESDLISFHFGFIFFFVDAMYHAFPELLVVHNHSDSPNLYILPSPYQLGASMTRQIGLVDRYQLK